MVHLLIFEKNGDFWSKKRPTFGRKTNIVSNNKSQNFRGVCLLFLSKVPVVKFIPEGTHIPYFRVCMLEPQ